MLDNTLSFLKLTRDLENVKRAVYRPDNRQENDTEHSYQVAMLAWFLVDQYKLNLSKEKILMYALAHDVVEVYAGDTPVYANETTNTQDNKKEREAKALERIQTEFGHFKEFLETIESYESMKDEEARFIYELDKLIPPLNIYLDKGFGWNKFAITLEEIMTEKRRKVIHSKELIELMEEMFLRFEKEKTELFIKN